MLGNMGIWQILLILAIILLIFGASRLPALAKSLGRSAREFKGEMKQMKDEDGAEGAEGGQPNTTDAPSSMPPATSSSDTSSSSPDVKP